MIRPPQLRHNYGQAYALDGRDIEQLLRSYITSIVGGRGIRTQQLGQQVIIEADPQGGRAVAGGGWMIKRATNYAALVPMAEFDGDLGFTNDLGNFYGMDGFNGWRILHPFVQDTAPASLGELDGDTWYAPTADRAYIRRGGAWEPLPWIQDDKLYYHDGINDICVSHYDL